ncbi:hypothetical protein BST95_13345 [Halioglobus japonicus]|uniref:DUF975 domain-containing protein n=1 Tax=Halioglobus japonicus TaxID=930805 RepID=A0AAP8MHA0_9GAMM|nr:hypothetical protein [Halioglobus japonicus]AQA19080.1 hypothetical protein BST95_13345 [Halioglobus japonicus]PLW87896.1 hypothetical protein C0029_04845 [Halioglobus japonicus]GHD05968.1 hypothetical protein GCM10007052_00190 [Halioglobus japonicus]
MDIIIEEQAEQGSLQAGLEGNTEFRLGAVLTEAWERTSGNKGAVWMAMMFYMGLAFLMGVFFGLLDGAGSGEVPDPGSPVKFIGDLVTTLVLTPMAIGLCFIGVAIARGYTPNPKSIFAWYDQTLKVFLLAILMNLLIVLGLLLLVLPGIYLAVSYQIALPLMVDKKMGLWEALESSRKIIGHHWFAVFGYDLVFLLIVAGSMMLLGIPFIWTVPMMLIAYGILYRNLVGVEAETLQRAVATEQVPS